MDLKTLPARVKATGDGADGSFEAIVSTYDVDSIRDQVVPGAFADTLTEWKASGNPIPVVWSHRHDDPFAHVGEVTDAAERDGEGLWVKGQLDMDNPTGRQVYKLLKGGRVNQFSFAYDVEDAQELDSGVMELRKLKLYEVGPTLIGMNQATRTLSVKEARDLAGFAATTTTNGTSYTITIPSQAKAGRVLSAKNETDLKAALELITAVLAQLDAATPDEPAAASSTTADGKTTATDGATKPEEPDGAKGEESSRGASVDALAAVLSLREKEIA